jgi:hypothetical protein
MEWSDLKRKKWSSFQSHILHFVNFIQVLFNYFNLCEIIRHFHWLPSLICGTRPKKDYIQLPIIQLPMSPDQSEPNISTDGACTDFALFRSTPYFPVRKLAFTRNHLLDRTGSEKPPIRCFFSGVEICLNTFPQNYRKKSLFVLPVRSGLLHYYSCYLNIQNNLY